MKYFLFSLGLFSLFSTATNASTLVKSLDGGVAVCKSQADLGKRAYRLKLLNETNTTTHKNLNIEVSLFSCSETANGIGLTPIGLDTVLEQIYLPMNSSEFKVLHSEFSNTRLVAFTEKGELFANNILNEKVNGKITSTVSLPRDLTAKQVVLTLNANQTLTTPEGELLDKAPVIMGTFLLNLN